MDSTEGKPISLGRQVLKSVLGGLAGAAVGVFAWYVFDTKQSMLAPVLIGILAIFAGS